MSFKQIINDFSEEDRKEFSNLRLDLLIKLTEIIKKHNGQPFLDCGTLLGAIREQNFIAWDNDMDVGLKYEDLNQEMINELNETFLIRMNYPHIDDFFFSSYLLSENGKEVKFKGQSIWIDLMIYYPYKDGLRIVSNDTPSYITNKLFTMPAFAISSFKEISFLGHNFFIPINEIAWLESYYTKEWRIPKPKRTRSKNWFKRDDSFYYNINEYKNKNEVKKLF